MRDDLVSVLRVACTHDDAVDWGATDVAAYVGSQSTPGDRDPAHIVAKPGRAVTWFHLRPISAPAFASWPEAAAEPGVRWLRSFQFSVEAIDNLETPGVTWRPSTLVPDGVTGRERAIVGEQELEHVRLQLGLPWIYEVGKVAYQRALEGNIRGGGVAYTLPPTSHSALKQNALLRADWLRMQQEADSATSVPASPTSSAGASG